MIIIKQARKKQLIVLKVNGLSFVKYQVIIGNGIQEAANPRNLGNHKEPLSFTDKVQPIKNNIDAGTPKKPIAIYSFPFHQSNTKPAFNCNQLNICPKQKRANAFQ